MADEQTILKALDAITLPHIESASDLATLKKLRTAAGRMLTAPHLSVSTVQRLAQNRHVAAFHGVLDSPNVVGVGIAEKTVHGRGTSELALTFYVERKLPLRRLMAHQAVPPTMTSTISGPTAIPTDVVVLGRLRPEFNVVRSPIQPGYSVGHFKAETGTLGAIVTATLAGAATSVGSTGELILSNSHVLARSGSANHGDVILYPGLDDGGKAADRVGTLDRFVAFDTSGQFVNTADCATALIDESKRDSVLAAIKGVGMPAGTATAQRDMKVVKVGRTTGKTTGIVRDVHFRFVLTYPGIGKVGFLDQALCTRYSDSGDSGSLVLEAATKRAVGLHFAGASGGSVFSPIDQVLNALKIRLVTSVRQ